MCRAEELFHQEHRAFISAPRSGGAEEWRQERMGGFYGKGNPMKRYQKEKLANGESEGCEKSQTLRLKRMTRAFQIDMGKRLPSGKRCCKRSAHRKWGMKGIKCSSTDSDYAQG